VRPNDTAATPARIPAPRPAARPAPVAAAPAADLSLAGCPPPPYHPPPASPPWHPATLVPDAALPPAPPPVRRSASLSALAGKGMWIWRFPDADHGDPVAVVADAKRAGLRQLWVRVGDSQAGFYGAPSLAALVPVAHANGIAVIGWGFPYLFDPVADAAWTGQALAWRAPDGQGLDGFSADIETADEGVALSPQRTEVYLGLVRRAFPKVLMVGTVFPPNDHFWATYPYASIAAYVDALAPMVYWGCDQPAADVAVALQRLRPLAPVHVIGQAYSMGDVGGRQPSPSPTEISTFLLAARSGGAVGASLWSWQSIDADEWAALSSYRW